MLELHDPDGAFDALEAYLEGEAFWQRKDAVADLFLGYGLSATLRRDPEPGPPEPCPRPTLACSTREAAPAPPTLPRRYELGEWERSWDDEAYGDAVEAVRAEIARGQVYQANLVQHLSAT